jgi:hypothetical protein
MAERGYDRIEWRERSGDFRELTLLYLSVRLETDRARYVMPANLVRDGRSTLRDGRNRRRREDLCW